MTQPIWSTPAGSLGVFPSGFALNLLLIAEPAFPAVELSYTLLNGILPEGINGDPVVFRSDGSIIGTPKNLAVETPFTFTVRATDNLGKIRDRTFSLNVFGYNNINIATPNGQLMVVTDSLYVDFDIRVNNPIAGNPYRITVSSGEFPPGLRLSESGKITGFPKPPTLANKSPTTYTYNFTVQLESPLGLDSKTYSIIIKNQQLSNPLNTRKPAILNTTPLVEPIDPADPYHAYYIENGAVLPTITANEYFSFKAIGHDFDGGVLQYSFGSLPDGLAGDTNTGWITGVPVSTVASINRFPITVAAFKISNPNIISSFTTFMLTITNDIVEDLAWVTPADLGSVLNGQISELFVNATSSYLTEYRIIDGSLPPNLSMLGNGEIAGRVPFQPTSTVTTTNTVYTFTVLAFLPQYPVVTATRTFTLTIDHRFNTPVESVYFKAASNLLGRKVINSLLTNDSLIPPSYLYRAGDSFFGKATDVSFVHAYGIESTNLQTYLNSTQQNHYHRKVVLGEIKTAIARDPNNNIVYEVVYADIIDDLINSKGESLPQQVVWPRNIRLSENENYAATSDVYVSSDAVYTTASQTYTTQLYPASTTNMRTEMLSKLKYNGDQNLLPLWMTTQQQNGNTLGFIQAWVICYTLPDKSATVKNLIDTSWEYKLNLIDFSIDRFIVDKSATFDFDTNSPIPSWTNLPSGVPALSSSNYYDLPVLFQQQTILPSDIGN